MLYSPVDISPSVSFIGSTSPLFSAPTNPLLTVSTVYVILSLYTTVSSSFTVITKSNTPLYILDTSFNSYLFSLFNSAPVFVIVILSPISGISSKYVKIGCSSTVYSFSSS